MIFTLPGPRRDQTHLTSIQTDLSRLFKRPVKRVFNLRYIIVALAQLPCRPNIHTNQSFNNCRTTPLVEHPVLLRYTIFFYLGADLPEVEWSGQTQSNLFQENIIVGGIESLTVKESDGNQFVDNAFEDAATIRFDDAARTVMLGNTGLDDTRLKVTNGASFDKISDKGYEPVQ